MTGQFVPTRIMSHVFVYLRTDQGKIEPGGGGLPDKSTAVGRGACGCLLEVFSAARHVAKTALSLKTSMKAPIHAPSLPFSAFQRALQ